MQPEPLTTFWIAASYHMYVSLGKLTAIRIDRVRVTAKQGGKGKANQLPQHCECSLFAFI